MVKKLRSYQQDICKRLHKILEMPERKAFLQMPTGTGKTFTALMFSQQLKETQDVKSVIWIVHQTNLYIQSAKDFLDDFKSLGGQLDLDLIDDEIEMKLNQNFITGTLNGVTYNFMTWQKLSRMVSAKQIKTNQYDLLIVDEAHYGSSENQLNEHKSFKKIFSSKLFKFHVYISATLWNLNPKVYPGLVCPNKKRAYSKFLAIYTTEQASKDKTINNTNFVCITSADTLKLKKLNDQNDEIELTASETKELAKKAQKTKVNIKHKRSKDSLYRAVVRQTIKAYLNKEDPKRTSKLPPTIVFCNGVERDDVRNIKNVEKSFSAAVDSYYGEKFKTGKGFISSVSAKTKDSYKTLKSFTKGEINILLVSNMAQEGFNYPQLEVAIDLNPNYNNTSRWNQKIGRITRKIEGKPAGRYYYADNISNYITTKGLNYSIKNDAKSLQEMIQNTNPDLTVEQKNLASEGLGANLIAIKNSKDAEVEVPQLIEVPEVKDVQTITDKAENVGKLKSKKTTVVITESTYIVSSADRKHNKTYDKQVSYEDLIKLSGENIPWQKLSSKQVEKIVIEFKKTGKDFYNIMGKYL